MATTNKTATVSQAKPKAAPKKKPTKQEAAAAAVEKMRQVQLPIAPQPAPSELVMMPLTLIETRDQVRTEFNDETIAELAADIAARGVLQPILLRRNPGLANFVVIAGERRLRAAKLAGLEDIPAIVGEIDDDGAAAMQIAENIQREDLSLADTAKAVRKLYELNNNSVTETAEKLHKSKAWVSKHLAASCPELPWQARQLLEKAVTADLEIVLTIAKIAELDYWKANQVARAVEEGNAGRQTVRDELERVKSWEEARKQAREQQAKEFNTQEAIAKRQAEQEQWEAEEAKRREKARLDPLHLRWRYDEELEADEREALGKHLKSMHDSGRQAESAEVVFAIAKMAAGDYHAIELAAYAAGSQGIKFDLAELIRITSEAIDEA